LLLTADHIAMTADHIASRFPLNSVDWEAMSLLVQQETIVTLSLRSRKTRWPLSLNALRV
jgi:hypothetical protein